VLLTVGGRKDRSLPCTAWPFIGGRSLRAAAWMGSGQTYLTRWHYGTPKEIPVSRKKVTNGQVRGIARKRMAILVRMSEEEALRGNLERAKRYMGLARRISVRTKVPMPEGALYCRRCSAPLVPGLNCRVRLRNHRIGTHCLECGSVRRRPYLRETKERRTCREER